jgi:ribosome maturation factor RimP
MNRIRGGISPLFIFPTKQMITVDFITKLLADKIQGTDVFVVEVVVKPGNNIVILLDSNKGVTIEDCVSVSRHIEFSLDREKEDFELSVMSAGLTEPFKVIKQYQKNIGKQVDVVTSEGKKYQGKLLDFDDKGIELEVKTTEKIEGKKKRQQVIKKIGLAYNQIKTTKLILLF